MIRAATDADLPALIRMGLAHFEAAQWAGHGLTADAASIAETLARLIHAPGGILLVLDAADGHAVGMVGGLVYPFYFDRSRIACQELFWWVEPKARGQGPGLLKAFEQAARDRGAHTIILTASEGLEADRLANLYRRRGYQAAERTFFGSI